VPADGPQTVAPGAPDAQGFADDAKSAPAPAAGSAAGSATAQMKRRSIAPAEAALPSAGAASAKEEAVAEARKEAAPASELQRTPQGVAPAPAGSTAPPAPQAGTSRAAAPAPAKQKNTAPPAPQAAAMKNDTARGQSFSEWGASKSLYKDGRADKVKGTTSQLSGLTATCGKVRDSRGNVVVGAQVTAIHNGVRTARTNTEGEFCIDGLKAGDTLTVMHVGFDPHTVVMTPMTSLAITLEPVGTLGPNATLLTGKAQTPPPRTLSGALGAHGGADSAAPSPDVYAGQSFGVRQLVSDAREATSVARRERTAPGFENAAKQWAAVLGQVKGAAADDARFQYISALRAAYQLEPTRERESRLRSAITSFLALAPASLPERATVVRWQAELNGASGR
jgi:hypothetical protein